MRDFELFDSKHVRLCAATSAWLVLDAQTHKPLRPDKGLAAIPTLSDRRALLEDPSKLPATSPQDSPGALSVSYSDLDVNQHVNNSRYVRWLLDSYPTDFHSTHSPFRLEINFVGETRRGDTLALSTAKTAPLDFNHTLSKSGTNVDVCRARLSWEAISPPQ